MWNSTFFQGQGWSNVVGYEHHAHVRATGSSADRVCRSLPKAALVAAGFLSSRLFSVRRNVTNMRKLARTGVSSPVLQRCGAKACIPGTCDHREEPVLQRQAGTPGTVPEIVYEVVRSPGQPLDQATRAFMEPRFGHDFSHVQVHADTR